MFRANVLLPALLLCACSTDNSPTVDGPIEDGSRDAIYDAGPDTLPGLDLPPLIDAGPLLTFDAPHYIRDPDGARADATPLTTRRTEQLLWAVESSGGGKPHLVTLYRRGDGVGLMLSLAGTIELAGKTFVTTKDQTVLAEFDGHGKPTRTLVVGDGIRSSCRAHVISDDTVLLCTAGSKPATFLPADPKAFAHAAAGTTAYLMVLDSQLALRYSRKLTGFTFVDMPPGLGLRVDERHLAIFGGFEGALTLDGVELARAQPRAVPWGGRGFVIQLRRTDGALVHTLAFSGGAGSPLGDVMMAEDGSMVVCGSVAGYGSEGAGLNLATVQAGNGKALAIVGFSDDDPAGAPFVVGFDAAGLARWAQSLYAVQGLEPRCTLAALGTNHFQLAIDGGGLLGAGQANAKLNGRGTIALYQNDGTFVDGHSFARGSNAQGDWALTPRALGGSRFRVASTHPAVLAYWGPNPLEVPATTARPGEILGDLQIVAESRTGNAARAVQWGLQVSVAKGRYPPQTIFLYDGDGRGYLAGTCNGYVDVTGQRLCQGGQLGVFLVQGRLAH